MWFIGVEVEQEKSAPPPKKNPGSALELLLGKVKEENATCKTIVLEKDVYVDGYGN